MDLIVPIATLAIVWAIGANLAHPRQVVYLPALAALSAHLAWNIAGVATFGAWGPFIPDFIVRVALIAWLWLRPNKWVAILLTLYSLWSATTYIADPLGGSGTNLPMLLLHACILAALVYGILKSRPVPGAA